MQHVSSLLCSTVDEFNSTFSSPGGNRDNVKVTFTNIYTYNSFFQYFNLICMQQKPTSKHIVPVTAQIIQACSQVENESSLYEYNHLKFNQVLIICFPPFFPFVYFILAYELFIFLNCCCFAGLLCGHHQECDQASQRHHLPY